MVNFLATLILVVTIVLSACGTKNSCAGRADRGGGDNASVPTPPKTVRILISQRFISDSKEQPLEKAPPLETIASNFIEWSGGNVVPANTADAEFTIHADVISEEIFADYSWSGPGTSSAPQHLSSGASVSGIIRVEHIGSNIFEQKFSETIQPPTVSGGTMLYTAISRTYTAVMIEAVGHAFGYAFLNKMADPGFLGSIYHDPASEHLEWELYDESIGRIRDPRAAEQLIEIMDRANKYEAADSLGEIKDPCAVDSLIEALEYYPWFFQDDYYGPTRESAAVALGKIGDPRALPALKRVNKVLEYDALWIKAQEAIKQIESGNIKSN